MWQQVQLPHDVHGWKSSITQLSIRVLKHNNSAKLYLGGKHIKTRFSGCLISLPLYFPAPSSPCSCTQKQELLGAGYQNSKATSQQLKSDFIFFPRRYNLAN